MHCPTKCQTILKYKKRLLTNFVYCQNVDWCFFGIAICQNIGRVKSSWFKLGNKKNDRLFCLCFEISIFTTRAYLLFYMLVTFSFSCDEVRCMISMSWYFNTHKPDQQRQRIFYPQVSFFSANHDYNTLIAECATAFFNELWTLPYQTFLRFRNNEKLKPHNSLLFLCNKCRSLLFGSLNCKRF